MHFSWNKRTISVVIDLQIKTPILLPVTEEKPSKVISCVQSHDIVFFTCHSTISIKCFISMLAWLCIATILLGNHGPSGLLYRIHSILHRHDHDHLYDHHLHSSLGNPLKYGHIPHNCNVRK